MTTESLDPKSRRAQERGEGLEVRYHDQLLLELERMELEIPKVYTITHLLEELEGKVELKLSTDSLEVLYYERQSSITSLWLQILSI